MADTWQRCRRRVSLLALAAALPLSLLQPGGIAVANEEPTLDAPASVEMESSVNALTPTGACAQYVQTPQILASDRHSDGSPITYTPSPSGHITPVVFVHGWVSWVTHNEDRTGYFSHYIDKTADSHAGLVLGPKERHTSLIGLIQDVPGAAPYLFDYSGVASRWVTDPQIGPRLGEALMCLARHYGVKPVVIAHSMGGNATREALAQPDGSGGTVADHVGRVVTFGTPNEGSDSAAMIAGIIDKAGNPPLLGAPARLLRHYLMNCGAEMDASGTPCLGNPVLDAFYSSGGQALRAGSPELAALPKWPAQVHVTALAGDIKIGGISMFGWNSRRALDVGDLLVSEKSAVAGATESHVVTCEYGIVSTRGVANGVKVIGGLIRGTTRPATLASTPCWHEALLRETTQTQRARDEVNAYATSPILDQRAPGAATDSAASIRR